MLRAVGEGGCNAFRGVGTHSGYQEALVPSSSTLRGSYGYYYALGGLYHALNLGPTMLLEVPVMSSKGPTMPLMDPITSSEGPMELSD